MTSRFRGVEQRTNEAARQHRKQPTPAESVLWEVLRGRKLDGLKFRRQQPLSEFIVDFVCAERKLIIEVDGESHLDQVDYDAARTEFLLALGYRVIRFTNKQVLNDLDEVLNSIRMNATSLGD